MKKKIKPEDLQLREETVNGSINAKGDASHNTCGIVLPPHGCDTTTTEGTVTCYPGETNNCNETGGVCKSDGCPHTYGCIQTQSDANDCCPLSDGKGDCNTTVCQVYPSVDFCLETEKNCGSGYTTCQKTMLDCLVLTEECVETNETCVQPELTADCRTEFCAAP